MTLSTRLRLAALAGGLAALAAAAPAAATTAALTPDGQFLDITESTPGEANNLTVQITSYDGVQYVELFDFVDATPGAGCAVVGARLRCTDPVQQIRVRTGAGDDRVTTPDTHLAFGPGALDVDLGEGNDTFTGDEESNQATVHGGPGNDDIIGGMRADVLDGGPGDDKVRGAEGADSVSGGDGNDVVRGDSVSDRGIAADAIDGGPGVDQLEDYVFSGDPMSAPAIDVSLDGQANDGRPGEGDNVVGVERIKSASAGSFTGDEADNEFVAPQTGPAGKLRGNGGNDLLIAGDAHGDVVEGGAGADTVEGGFGDDQLDGGAGPDTIAGDRKSRCNEMACDILVAGNDTIQARDGEADSISCGPGTDRVVADDVDVVDADCETVERAGPVCGTCGGGPGGKAKLALAGKRKLRVALRRGLKVRATGVSGKVKLRAKARGKVVAKGSAQASGGTAVVVLRFTKRARRTLARRAKVRLTISGAGARQVVTLRR